MLDDMKFERRDGCYLEKQKTMKQNLIKSENYQENKPWSQVHIYSPTEIKTDHGNKTSIYILNIYLFLTLVN